MKINLAHLAKIVSTLHYRIVDFGSNADDVIVDINILEANPGEGRMMDMLTISGEKTTPATHYRSETTTVLVGELFEASDCQPPRLTKKETEILT